jgi:heat shock protein HtpX
MMRAKRLFRTVCAALVAIALPAEQASAQGQDRGPSILRDAETEQFLQDISAGMAQSAGLTPGALHLYVINDPEINAFVAQGQIIYINSGTIERADNANELEGVIAHELSHVKHRDILTSSVAATLAAAIMMLARMAQFAAFFGGYGGRGDGRDRGNNPIALLATLILAPLAAVVIQMWISRTREYAADAGGAQIAGNPYGLVEALKKIDAVSKRVPLDANPATAHMFIIKPFAGAGLMSLFSSHPPTEDRIRALLGTAR